MKRPILSASTAKQSATRSSRRSAARRSRNVSTLANASARTLSPDCGILPKKNESVLKEAYESIARARSTRNSLAASAATSVLQRSRVGQPDRRRRAHGPNPLFQEVQLLVCFLLRAGFLLFG